MVGLDKQQERELLLRRGSFKCAHPYEMVFVMLIRIAEIGSALFWFVKLDIIGTLSDADMTEMKFTYYLLIMSGISFVMAIFFAIATMGRNCEYRAEKDGFVIEGPGKRNEYFYYNDVLSVDYEPLKLFFRNRGYLVTIETGVRVIRYRYIFTEKKILTEFEDTPFYFLAVNSGLSRYEDRPSGVTAEQVAAMYVRKGNEQIAEESRVRSGGRSLGIVDVIRRL